MTLPRTNMNCFNGEKYINYVQIVENRPKLLAFQHLNKVYPEQSNEFMSE
jgi:hypothetical protein